MHVHLYILNKEQLRFKPGFFIILLLILYYLSFVYINYFTINESIYYNTLGGQLSYDKIQQILSIKQRYQWIALLMLPIMLFLRMFLTSACLAIGCFLSDIKLSFKDFFRIALVAEICLAIGMVVRIIYLTFMPINTLADIENFSPLSLAQLLGPESIPKYLLYLCQTVNIFEMAYWLVLAAGLVAFLKKPFNKMFRLVMSSYGVGLLLWIIFVSYLTVTLSP